MIINKCTDIDINDKLGELIMLRNDNLVVFLISTK